MRKRWPRRRTPAKLLVLAVVCTVLLTTVLHRYVFAVYIIDGASMAPTLNDGDTALVNMLVRVCGRFDRGEIVLVEDGLGGNATKRIVGLPGETVEIRKSQVFIDGRPFQERYLPRRTTAGSDCPAVALGADEYFVLGDNRSDSYDSRIYGPVSKRCIVGSYTRTFWAFR
ncbi:MAG: signal peptidase I [Verrucomicrobiia bacterium]